MGFNEAAGYLAIALAAWATGAIAEVAGLRPEPFFLGLAFAALGLMLSALFVRETQGHVALEVHTSTPSPTVHDGDLTPGQVFALTSWRDRTLAAVSRAGLVNNINEGMAWGLLPVLFASAGLGLGTVGALIAIAPAVWGIGQLATGALSDRIGRKGLIVAGQFTQAAGLLIIGLGREVGSWVVGSVLFGAGTAMAYPTLIAAVGDVANPRWRGAAVGVYRLWRDVGFAVGAVLAGVIADLYSIETSIIAVAIVTAFSGLDVMVGMQETHPRIASLQKA